MFSPANPFSCKPDAMPRIVLTLLLTGCLLPSLVWSQVELPLASFIFNHQHLMRVGHQAQGVFVQIRPLPEEGEYRLALRVLRDGASQFRSLRDYPGGATLSPHQWITLPLHRLHGAIQGAALEALFPQDQPTASGWKHTLVYDWESATTVRQFFLRESISTGQVLRLNGLTAPLTKGQEVLLPWSWLRPDLELQPVELRPPLVLQTEPDGQRFATYQIQAGETLYSSVVTRFLGRSKHQEIVRTIGDLLALNQLRQARAINPGQIIRIPLDWVSPKYLKPVSWTADDQPPEHPETAPTEDLCLLERGLFPKDCAPTLRTASNS